MLHTIATRHRGLVKLGTGTGMISIGILLIFLNYTNGNSVDFLFPLILSSILIVSGIGTIDHAGRVDTKAHYEADFAEINSPGYTSRFNLQPETLTGNWKERHLQMRERRRKNNEILTVSFVIGIFLVIFPVVMLARNVPMPVIISALEGYAITTGFSEGIVYSLTHVFWRGTRTVNRKL